tara:strand:- start:67 stop:471 length:405 start_codon:yes stop_codon:yes gene_type:complete
MLAILTIIHVLSALAIIGLVLIQHGKGADAGAAFGSGSAGSIFGARGPATFLTRATGILAAVFFVTSLSLAYLSGQTVERRSITERVAPVEQAASESDAPAAPASGSRSARDSDVPQLDAGTNEENAKDTPPSN